MTWCLSGFTFLMFVDIEPRGKRIHFLMFFFLSRSTAIFSFICCICTFELELHLSCNCTCDQKDTFSVPHKVWKGTVCQMPTFCQLTKKSPSSCPATVDLIICVIQLFFLRDPAHHRLGQHRRHFLARSAVSRLLLESAVLWSIEAEPKFWICWKILIIHYSKFWICRNILIALN